MSAMHPSRGWKGCALCKWNKVKGQGQADRMPWAAKRQLGEKRRIKRSGRPSEDD